MSTFLHMCVLNLYIEIKLIVLIWTILVRQNWNKNWTEFINNDNKIVIHGIQIHFCVKYLNFIFETGFAKDEFLQVDHFFTLRWQTVFALALRYFDDFRTKSAYVSLLY